MPNENIRKLLRHMEQARTVETSDVMHGGMYNQTLKRPVGGAKKSQEAKEAKAIGEQYAKHILQSQGMKGGSFWKDFKKGFDSVIKPAASVAKAIAPAVGPHGKVAKDVIEAVGYGSQTGGNFWGDFTKGFKQGFDMVAKPVSGVVKAAAPALGPYGMAASVGLNALGYGKKPKQKRTLSAKQQKRNALVRELMKKYNLTLPEASRYIKENNLM